MGFHKDDEKELSRDVPIASLSLGAERDFIFQHHDRRRSANRIANEKLVLRDGQLLLMRHPTNQLWYHGLPARQKCVAPRINLTFRSIIVTK